MTHIKDDKLQILPFAPAHLAGVERLEQLCFAHPWQRADLAAQLTNPCAHFLVAVLDGAVVGYLGVQVVCGEGSVTNVAVDPAYRRRGIARALFGACFAGGNMDFLPLEVRRWHYTGNWAFSRWGGAGIFIQTRRRTPCC